eukprot:TRINITY_DN7417_c0_g1_i1.p1 TRINITY_DN7417_c0_g1~~TRINITY_DN7417_c0_g1_i1.p1  ORF type:complete len:461 (+),score=135.20 TRINITY_DN7417_c0_g1_i1:52-1434(+)
MATKMILGGVASIAAIGGVIYVLLDGKGLAKTNPLLPQAVQAFRAAFSPKDEELKELVGASAPGRVNLIGEHTDYNDGFVCPMAIERSCFMVARFNKLSRFRIVDANMVGKDKIPIVHEFSRVQMVRPPARDEKPTWDAYIRGVVAQYVRMLKKSNKSFQLPCFDLAFASDVPLGGGLSSSAALEVSTATLMDALLNLSTPLKDRALMSQKAEHEFAKMPCGIMDQFISALAQPGHALLLDCRSLETKAVKMTDPNITILITNTHVKHKLSTGEYAKRRKSCEKAVAILKEKKSNIKALRDVTMEELQTAENDLQDNIIYRRARHVIGENTRTTAFVKAMEAGKYEEAGKLMYQSHYSLRDDYEVSCKELDILVEIAKKCPGVYGSRMTGGGFGGCTVTLVNSAMAEKVAKTIEEEYKKATDITTQCLFTRASTGTRFVPKMRITAVLAESSDAPIRSKL